MLSTVRRPLPQVTGISPKEGPPGTRVTIRGEDLGCSNKDLIGLRICGIDCMLSAEWKSSNKIIARTGQAKGKGDIIVVTRSGGVGTCTVQFKCYHVSTGPLQDSAIWVDESQLINNLIGRNRVTSPLAGHEHDDPLGISDESNETPFPEDELTELFPNSSGNTASENFVVQRFLLENHHGTSFNDLKAGLAYLQRRTSQQHEGPLAFVKSNLTTFMDCQDTLAEMHHILVADQANSKTVTGPLQDLLLRSNKSADILFNDVLGRKDRADATRNALGVLHRFKFLFNLPCSIDRNVQRGDYDLVITDYARAKLLFGDTEINVFKKVYQEVENRVAAFRETLTKKLMTLPSTLDDQKRLIRCLVQLEVAGDPAWDCLIHMQTWLKQLLHLCKDENIKKLQEGDKKEEHPSPAKSLSQKPKSGSKVPQKVQFVETMTRVLADHVPNLWRLGQAYLSGKLFKDAKEKSLKVDAKKQDLFKEMIHDVVQSFANLIRAAFLPSTLEKLSPTQRNKYGHWPDNQSDSPTAWLPVCVRHIRWCVLTLLSLDLDSASLGLLQELAFDMRTNCISTLFSQAQCEIEALYEAETWTVEVHDERGGTTLLPALFENVVCQTLQYLQDVIQSKSGEKQIFSEEGMRRSVGEQCGRLLQAFVTTMDRLAAAESETTGRERKRTTSTSSGIPPRDKRLIIMLSNCQHTLEHLVPRLADSLSKHGYPDTTAVLQLSQKAYTSLGEQLFEAYVEEKSNPIIGTLEMHMYAGHFDWSSVHSCCGVRRYVKEAMMGMIEVHAEVYSISPRLVTRVMRHVVGGVVDEMSRLIQCVPSFNENGKMQALVDLTALQIAVDPYKSTNTVQSLAEASEHVGALPKDVRHRRLLEDLLSRFRKHMQFQLTCFKYEPATPLSAAA